MALVEGEDWLRRVAGGWSESGLAAARWGWFISGRKRWLDALLPDGLGFLVKEMFVYLYSCRVESEPW